MNLSSPKKILEGTKECLQFYEKCAVFVRFLVFYRLEKQGVRVKIAHQLLPS